MNKPKNTKKTVETDNLKNGSIGRDNNKVLATVSSKEKTMKQTTNKKTLTKEERELIAIDNYNNNSYQVIDGKNLSKKEVEKLEKYLRDNWNAAIVTNTVNTLQISYVKLCKEFSNWSGAKVSAQSLDLHKTIVTILHNISKEIKEQSAGLEENDYNKVRIPVLKSHQEQGSRLCSMSLAYYSDYYETSDTKETKAKETKAKAEASKKAKEAKAKAEEQKRAEEIESLKNRLAAATIDTPDKANACIISLFAQFGNQLDLNMIQKNLDLLYKSANAENTKIKKIA